ncbi:trypsin-like peptidase domain-containing protein [Geodermatophilus sp. SYSU D00710]
MRERVAELLVERTGQPLERGSGYLVASGWVLTAAHVVADAETIGVWLGAPTELTSEAQMAVAPGAVLLVPEADLALVPVAAQSVERVLFGRLDRATVEPLPAVAAGFPRHKLRTAPGRPGVLLRELRQAQGSVVAGSNAKTGTLEFAVHSPPPDDPQRRHSPWEGMSGAGVFTTEGRLFGVVGQHHPEEGAGTLTLLDVAPLLDAPAETVAAWRRALPQLPAPGQQLDCVNPPTARDLVVAKAQVAAVAVRPEVLVGRERELVDLAEFCHGPQRWRWIQAEAFAGKTALLATFVLHPPGDVDVAACFLRRTTGQASADYALDVLSRQLAVHAQKPQPPSAPVAERVAELPFLLRDAAGAAQQRGHRLLVLVDGLDEDQTVESGLAVARWLPDATALPDNAWLLVASRAGVPLKLDGKHPLRRHAWPLSVSPVASKIREAAEAELGSAREAADLNGDLIGLLSIASGGLSSRELAELTRRFGHRTVTAVKVRDSLGKALSRSLRTVPDDDEPEQTVHVFAHELLLQEARDLFQDDLPDFQRLIDDWADDYAARGWPPDTPRYLLVPYGQQLAQLGPIERLASLAANPTRHDRMLIRTNVDAAALAEIEQAQQLLVDRPDPNLTELALLAVERERLTQRNEAIPRNLPALWVRLGRPHRGVRLAQAISSRSAQAHALAEAARALAQTGHADRAEEVAVAAEETARTVPDYRDRTGALVAAARGLALVGRTDRVEQIVDTIYHTLHDSPLTEGSDLKAVRATQVALAEVQAVLADALASAAIGDRAEQIPHTVPDTDDQATAQIAGAEALIAAGYADRAEQIAGWVPDPVEQRGALAAVTEALTDVDHGDRAEQVAAATEEVARAVPDPAAQARVLTVLAEALVGAGRTDRAEQVAAAAEKVARTVSEPAAQARVLTVLAEALVGAGRTDRAEQVAAAAEKVARTVPDPAAQAGLLGAGATLLGAARYGDRAQQMAIAAVQIARTIPDHLNQGWAMVRVVSALAAVGYPDRAEQIAGTIPDRRVQANMLSNVARALATAGHADRAECIARAIPDPSDRGAELALELAGVAEALAAADHAERAVQVAVAAEQAAISDPSPPSWIQSAVVRALAAVGQLDRAEQMARTIPDPGDQTEALLDVARALRTGGHADHAAQVLSAAEQAARRSAEQAAQRSYGYPWSDLATLHVVEALAAVGQFDRAEQTARSIPEPYWQATALSAVSTGMADAGLPDRAEQTARSISDHLGQARALARLARVLASAGHADRAAQIAAAAQQTARFIPGSTAQVEALGAVLVNLVDGGEQMVPTAQEIARSMPGRAAQADALAVVARVLTGLAALRAPRSFALILVTPHWLDGLKLLGRADSEALLAVSDAVLTWVA